MKLEDRKYQDKDVDYAMSHGFDDKIIHCAPTGSGKTIMQAKIAKRELDRGDYTAILTPRDIIFNQTANVVTDMCGVENVSILRAKRPGEGWNPSRPVHIVMWPTLIARSAKTKGTSMEDFWFPNVQRVLIDECHLSMAPKILEILHHYAPKARIDGYTATPARQTGKGLGRFFTAIKHVTTVRQLVKDGYLCPIEYWGGSTPDMAGIKIVCGDFEVKKLSDASIKLVGDVVDNWLRLASDRHTIVFAVDIAHCEMLAHRFKAAGVRAAALHVRMDQDDRDRTVDNFKSGNIQVLCNVSIASYGFDAPSVNCIVIARKTLSIVLHLQMIGRGMRPGIDADGNRITDPNDPDFKVCIAKGQLVLTDGGMVPIELVTTKMKVWDGGEFVYHDGVESRGEKKVIHYAGLTATPDHKVWTPSGQQRKFIDCANEGSYIAVTEYQGAPIWASHGFVRSDYPRQQRPPYRSGQMWGLWKNIDETSVKRNARHGWVSFLRSLPRPVHTKVAVSEVQLRKREVLQQKVKAIFRLWWPWNRVSFWVAACNGFVDTGKPWPEKTFHNRPNKKQRPLRAWQPAVGDEIRAANEQAEVFDIVNAGPRHRFTVSGLLVSNCRVLDHAGNVPALGQADDLFRWRLDDGKKATARVNEQGEPEEPNIHTCKECGHIFSQSRVCPKCGWKVPFSKQDVETVDADLVRIGKSMTARLPEGWPTHEIFYSMLLHHQKRLGYSEKWAAAQFKQKCDTWPPFHWNDFVPLPPSKRVKNWIHSRRIAYAKGREKAAASGR